ncbi:MAG: SpoIIE family protein phosphatase, partial [Desulfobacterales bacterium]|nr:SpoIIE family protein phosphatase [Desulfobacterales bacterium]
EHCPLHRSMITGTVTALPIIAYARGKDGQRIPMQITAAPLFGANGEIVGGVESFRDLRPQMGDLKRARLIQKNLLTEVLPKDDRLKFAAFYMPFDLVGGDYYAVEKLGADQYGFLLADLEGHGTAPALYMMHLKTLWDRYYPLMRQPADFAATVNRDLAEVFGGDVSFACAVCGLIDLKAQTMRLTSAGGPPPILCRANGAHALQTSIGLPFGVAEEIDYEETTLAITSGDAFLFVTDGAFEIDNARQEQLGIEGLIAVLKQLDYPATPLNMHRLEEQLLLFSNEIRLQDDLTILEVGFKHLP